MGDDDWDKERIRVFRCDCCDDDDDNDDEWEKAVVGGNEKPYCE